MILCPFGSISVISGQWMGGNERQCEMEPCLGLIRSLPQGGFKPRTAISVGQCLSY